MVVALLPRPKASSHVTTPSVAAGGSFGGGLRGRRPDPAGRRLRIECSRTQADRRRPRHGTRHPRALLLEQVTGKPIGQLYRERILQPLGLRATAISGADPSSPRPHPPGLHAVRPVLGGGSRRRDRLEPVGRLDRGGLTSTAQELLSLGRAMGTGEGLLPPEQQAERLDSMLPEPGKPEAGYGLGLMGMRDWIGHTGEIPGFTATLFYHRGLHATVVVLVNSDIASGGCPRPLPTLAKNRRDHPCDAPANLIDAALADALGKPIPPPRGSGGAGG